MTCWLTLMTCPSLRTAKYLTLPFPVRDARVFFLTPRLAARRSISARVASCTASCVPTLLSSVPIIVSVIITTTSAVPPPTHLAPSLEILTWTIPSFRPGEEREPSSSYLQNHPWHVAHPRKGPWMGCQHFFFPYISFFYFLHNIRLRSIDFRFSTLLYGKQGRKSGNYWPVQMPCNKCYVTHSKIPEGSDDLRKLLLLRFIHIRYILLWRRRRVTVKCRYTITSFMSEMVRVFPLYISLNITDISF